MKLKDKNVYFRKDENGKDVSMVLHTNYQELLIDLNYIKSLVLSEMPRERIRQAVHEAEARALPGLVPDARSHREKYPLTVNEAFKQDEVL